MAGMANKGRHIVIAVADSEELAYMDAMHVNALTRGVSKSEIWLRENPFKIAALENFYMVHKLDMDGFSPCLMK